MGDNPKKAFGDKKPPLAQLPLIAHIHAALAFYDGSGKYGYRNWRENPVEARTYVEAMLRHARLWENGEEFARDTGVHNLGGVIASAALLLDAQANGCLIDNRVVSQAACDLLHAAEEDIARLNAQHAALRAKRAADAEAQEAVEGSEGDTASLSITRNDAAGDFRPESTPPYRGSTREEAAANAAAERGDADL